MKKLLNKCSYCKHWQLWPLEVRGLIFCRYHAGLIVAQGLEDHEGVKFLQDYSQKQIKINQELAQNILDYDKQHQEDKGLVILAAETIKNLQILQSANQYREEFYKKKVRN